MAGIGVVMLTRVANDCKAQQLSRLPYLRQPFQNFIHRVHHVLHVRKSSTQVDAEDCQNYPNGTFEISNYGVTIINESSMQYAFFT